MKIFNFNKLFEINKTNTKSILNKEKYYPVSQLIKLKDKILYNYGVYLIFDKRISQKKSKNIFNNLIYIGQAGGNIQKNVKKGECFFDRIHKHWLVTIGADKYYKIKPYSGIQGSSKWRSFRDKKNKEITYSENFFLEENHENFLVSLVTMKNETIEDKVKIKMFEEFLIFKFFKMYGKIPVCNSEKPRKDNVNLFKLFEKTI